MTSRRPGLIAMALAGLFLATACGGESSSSSSTARPDGVPAKGESRIIDSVLDRGTLRVGVYREFPWLTENEKGGAEPYEGPAWLLATKMADALGVKIEPVKVSNDTKVATVQSGQVDIAIAPLTVTADREKVIDFIEYSQGTICFFGLEANPKLAGIKTSSELKASTGVRVAYLLGQPFTDWQKKAFPNLEVEGVNGSGEAATPELLSGRTDLVNAICAKSQLLKKAVGGLYSIPADPTTSQLNPNPIGMGVSQDDPVFEKFLNGIKDKNLKEVQKVEHDRVLGLSE